MSTRTMQPRINFNQIKQLQHEARHAQMDCYGSHGETMKTSLPPTPAPLPVKGSFQNLHMAHCNPLDLKLDFEAPQQHPAPLNSPDLEVAYSELAPSFLIDDDSDDSDSVSEVDENDNKRLPGMRKTPMDVPSQQQDDLTQTLTQKISMFPLRPHSPKVQKFHSVPKHRSSKTLKSLLKVEEGQLNYVVYSSKDNLSDATIFGTQINILQTVAYHSQQKQQQKKQMQQHQQQEQNHHKSTNDNVQESVNPAIPLPQTEYETVSIRVNKSIKEEYKKRKRQEDRGGYYASVSNDQVGYGNDEDGDNEVDQLKGHDNGEQKLAQEQDEYALIKAFKLTCGKSNKSTASPIINDNNYRVDGLSLPHSNDNEKSQNKKKHRHLVWDLSHRFSVMMFAKNNSINDYNNGGRVISERKDLLNYEDGEFDTSNQSNDTSRNLDSDYYLDMDTHILDRLPNLQEVLNKQTVTPVDLWSFYTFISSYPQALNCLDFYIDVATHLRFCKEYVRDIRKSVRSFVDKEQHLLRKRNTASRSVSAHNSSQHHHSESTRSSDPTVPSVLLYSSQSPGPESQTQLQQPHQELLKNGLSDFLGSLDDGINNANLLGKQDITQMNRSSKRVSQFLNKDLQSQLMNNVLKTWRDSSLSVTREDFQNSSDEYDILSEIKNEVPQHEPNAQNNTKVQPSTPGLQFEWQRSREIDAFITGQGIKTKLNSQKLLTNAESIVSTYLLSPTKSPKYLRNMPESLKNDIIHQILNLGKYDPEIFETCKELSFQILEQDMFPIFLQEVGFHNLHDRSYSQPMTSDVPTSTSHLLPSIGRFPQVYRISIGLVFLWIALWVGYTLIFLNYKRQIRVVTLVPFSFAWYFIITGITKVDLLYAWAGVTQSLHNAAPDMFGSSESVNSKNSGTNDKEQPKRNNSSLNNNPGRANVSGSIVSGSSSDQNSARSFINHTMAHKSSWNLLELGVFSSSSKTPYHEVPWTIRLLQFDFLRKGNHRGNIVVIKSPFIARLILRRSVSVLAGIVLMTAISTVIFSCVPGHRL
ncbi:hypothetical protein ACO0QE_003358 [Hanseniaspora vineae]